MMFQSARIKLTAWYVLIIMIVTLSFSVFMYAGVSQTTERALENQERRFEREYDEDLRPNGMQMNQLRPRPFLDPETIIEVRERTFFILLLINIAILLFSSALGYFLSGRTLEPIEIMIEKQKRFISDAAHEMKTPLTVMKTDLEVTLRDKNLSVEDSRKALVSSIEEIDKLNNFVNHLLTQIRFQSNSFDDEKKDLDFKLFIEAIVERLSPIAIQKGVTVKSSLEPVRIFAYAKSLETVFSNLIENAIKYNKLNGEVSVSLSRVKNVVVVKIEDTGIGIENEDLDKVFDSFYRADKSRSSKGHGLGLTIAKEIIEKHGGNISVESLEGKGSTFIVKLPIVAHS